MTASQTLAAPHADGVAASLEVVPKFVALLLGVLTSDTDVVGDERSVCVRDATLLVEGDRHCTLLDLVWVGDGRCHEAGRHEGEKDGLDGHEHVCGCCGCCP